VRFSKTRIFIDRAIMRGKRGDIHRFMWKTPTKANFGRGFRVIMRELK
jgi:hypothetical protein